MRVDCALLCDAATVREGLLHILGGGVTRITRGPTWPAPLGVGLALRIIVHPTENDMPHNGRVLVQAEDGEKIAEVAFGFQSDDSLNIIPLAPGEESTLCVALPLQYVGLNKAGGYSVEVLIDNVHQSSVPFRVLEADLNDQIQG